jgi:DNA-binding NtrC family response regulator
MPETESILVLDDDPVVLKSLREFLLLERYDVSCAGNLEEAVAHLKRKQFGVAICDVRLAEGSGFDLLDHIVDMSIPTVVIMLTGYGTIEDAVRAIKCGAFDYITKPISDDEVKLTIERALRQQELVEENNRLRRQLNMTFRLDTMVCRDPTMKEALELVKTVADTDATVMLTGESGTGKTLTARAIHMNSRRAGKPFIEVNCGALPDTLLESELFGHVKGAFSGAIADKSGRFDAADGGTLFLDEISLASPSLQVKLLRVLEGFKFERVGSNVTREVNVRLILATNQDLSQMVRDDKFREDLFYRINVMNIFLPPLRDRPLDIPPLSQHFLQRYRGEASNAVETISPEAMRILSEQPWPGNVRELENVIQRAVLLCRGSHIVPEDLAVRPVPIPGLDDLTRSEGLPLKEVVKNVERRLILEEIKACHGNRKEAARRLQINRTTLYNKLHEYGVVDT